MLNGAAVVLPYRYNSRYLFDGAIATLNKAAE